MNKANLIGDVHFSYSYFDDTIEYFHSSNWMLSKTHKCNDTNTDITESTWIEWIPRICENVRHYFCLYKTAESKICKQNEYQVILICKKYIVLLWIVVLSLKKEQQMIPLSLAVFVSMEWELNTFIIGDWQIWFCFHSIERDEICSVFVYAWIWYIHNKSTVIFNLRLCKAVLFHTKHISSRDRVQHSYIRTLSRCGKSSDIYYASIKKIDFFAILPDFTFGTWELSENRYCVHCNIRYAQ